MVFSSIVFLLYFLPLFLITYFLVDKKYKNLVILFFSIAFYSWGAPKFIFVILGTTFIDFHLVKWMSATESENRRKVLLALSVSVNLGLLLYFKYSNFFIDNVNSLLGLLGGGDRFIERPLSVLWPLPAQSGAGLLFVCRLKRQLWRGALRPGSV